MFQVTIASADNFSYNEVATDIRIPIRQQMIVYEEILVDGTSDLISQGDLVLIG